MTSSRLLSAIERLTTPQRDTPINERHVRVTDIDALVEDWRRLDHTVRGHYMNGPTIDATDPNKVIVVFGGPAGAGKTLLSKRLREMLVAEGFALEPQHRDRHARFAFEDTLVVKNVPATVLGEPDREGLIREEVRNAVDRIISGILVHGFDNDAQIEDVLNRQADGIRSAVTKAVNFGVKVGKNIAYGMMRNTTSVQVGVEATEEAKKTFREAMATARNVVGSKLYVEDSAQDSRKTLQAIRSVIDQHHGARPTPMTSNDAIEMIRRLVKPSDGKSETVAMSDLDLEQLQHALESAAQHFADSSGKCVVVILGDEAEAFQEAMKFGGPLVMKSIAMSDLGLGERPTSINDWIGKQIRDRAQHRFGSDIVLLTPEDAAEIAQGAALHVIADKATLITNLANEVHAANVKAGWWNDLTTGEDLHGKRNIGELLCLVHSEISEAMEGHRKGLPDDKLPHRPMFRVELIDALIRILDLLGADNREHPAGTIFEEKRAYNAKREDHKPENRRQAGGKQF